ncbi:MAG: hypothetical protein A3F67_02480 [Verrucomicrobia bacterium RIFCSPHIGHO2_12_FULL_41_10]|nr:MAG: hypothetical protein A3F67_02480 [Verrucomicrobia bacterium RIFCSPHIGHO2_12_FULL_41_10]HLB34191.1 hypothetical protein [Chthoniobacterales bacterium]
MKKVNLLTFLCVFIIGFISLFAQDKNRLEVGGTNQVTDCRLKVAGTNQTTDHRQHDKNRLKTKGYRRKEAERAVADKVTPNCDNVEEVTDSNDHSTDEPASTKKSSDEEPHDETTWTQYLEGACVFVGVAVIGKLFYNDLLSNEGIVHSIRHTISLTPGGTIGQISSRRFQSTPRRTALARWSATNSFHGTMTPAAEYTMNFSSNEHQASPLEGRNINFLNNENDEASFSEEEDGNDQDEAREVNLIALFPEATMSEEEFESLLKKQKVALKKIDFSTQNIDRECDQLEQRLNVLTSEELEMLCKAYQKLLDCYHQQLTCRLLYDQTLEMFLETHPEKKDLLDKTILKNRLCLVNPLLSHYDLDLGDICLSWEEAGYERDKPLYEQRQKEVQLLYTKYNAWLQNKSNILI